jgi:hypothetical protein
VDNYEKPVGYFMDDYYYGFVNDQTPVLGILKIKKNDITLHDEFFGIFDTFNTAVAY